MIFWFNSLRNAYFKWYNTIVSFRYEYPPFPETGGHHGGFNGVWCLTAFGCVSIVLIYYFETRCCKGEGLRVAIRSFIPSVSLHECYRNNQSLNGAVVVTLCKNEAEVKFQMEFDHHMRCGAFSNDQLGECGQFPCEILLLPHLAEGCANCSFQYLTEADNSISHLLINT